MEFKDLDFHENRGGGPKSEASPAGIAAKAVFGNYRLSVIRLPEKSLYEVAIFDMSNNFVRLPGIHKYDDDVIPHLTEEEVEEIMLKLVALPSFRHFLRSCSSTGRADRS